MTEHLPELERLSGGLILDGELVVWDDCGHPDFHLLSRRMLHGDTRIAVCFVIFDLLAVEGLSVMCNPYADRRALLEELDLDGPHWRTAPTFEDGQSCGRRS